MRWVAVPWLVHRRSPDHRSASLCRFGRARKCSRFPPAHRMATLPGEGRARRPSGQQYRGGNMDADRVGRMGRPRGLPFRINKIGHVVLHVRDIERSTKFYTEVLGLKISDIYAGDELPGGAV